MTRQDAINEYIELYYGDIYNLKRELETGDKIKARCGLLDYFDALAKDGRITEKQRNSWTAPAMFY